MAKEEQDYGQKLLRNISAAELKQLYERLEGEERPYHLTVHEGVFGMREIELSTDEDNTSYFNALLYALSGEPEKPGLKF